MKLFEPATIGTLSLKNRIIMAPMSTLLFDKDGNYGQEALDFHVSRAKGGTGLIITGAMRPSKHLDDMGDPTLSDSRCTQWLHELATAVHNYGAKLGVCLSPGFGRNRVPNPRLPNGGLISASAVPAKWNHDIICREVTIPEIDQLMSDVERSAKSLYEAGVDMVELHAHCGYLIDEFLTPLWNKRHDRYGGSLDNRLRFSCELIQAVKKGAGKDFPVCYRYALTHYLEGGRTIEEGLEIAKRIEAAGVEIIGVDAGCYETMHWSQPTTTQASGCLVPLAEAVKKVVNVPVIAVGKLGDPALAESVLQENKADFIGLGRALLSDPDWSNKVQSNRCEDITPCLACHEGCLKRVAEGKVIRCAVNPACGREKDGAVKPANSKRKILVVGSGPAGMEAAITAASRGHEVTLVEKNPNPGGNLVPASIPDFKQDYKKYLDYQIRRLAKSNVKVMTGSDATPELVRQLQPDAVILAAGATHCIPEIPNISREMEKGNTVTGIDVLTGKEKAGSRVIIIGAGMVGCEVALFLAEQGRKVTMVEIARAMRDIYWINALDIKDKIKSYGVVIMENTTVKSIEAGQVMVVDASGQTATLEADTIVVATGLQSNNELVAHLKDKVEVLYSIGDCVKTGKVLDAVTQGFDTAQRI